MKVLVVGAGGKTGRAVVERAAEAGHQVTALLHSTSDDDTVPGVAVLVGDASDADTMEAAVAGQDAVIDTVGGKTPYRHTALETSVASTIIAAMQRHGVRRLIVTSSIGVGDSTTHTPAPVKIVVATFLRGSTRDKTRMESAVRNSGLDWTITRPAVLNDKPATGGARVLTTENRNQAHSLTRTDLAAFLVTQLTSDDHLRQAVTITND